MNIELEFNHGLGDCVQFTSVLKHIKHYNPDWGVVFKAGTGRSSIANGLCHTSNGQIDKKIHVHWWECHHGYTKYPSTKLEQSLLQEFGLEPIPELLTYTINVCPTVYAHAENYYKSIGAVKTNNRYNVLIMHYQGNTSTQLKNLNHEEALAVCNLAISIGVIPVILDWDDRSGLPDNKRIFCPNKYHPLWNGICMGDAETIAALIERAKACVAIDSGPGHVAGATTTSTIIAWISHHPIHYYQPISNVRHVIPANHGYFIRANRTEVLRYFCSNYKYTTYYRLLETLLQQTKKLLC